MNIKHCPCCNLKVHHFVQESLVPGKLPARTYYECTNTACDMYKQTLTAQQFLDRCQDVKDE
jgi:hypothetical protein